MLAALPGAALGLLGLLAVCPPRGASAVGAGEGARLRLQASARQPTYDEVQGPGDVSGVPELEDVLRGIGMHELYEDTVASADQVMEVVEHVARDVPGVATDLLKTAQGTARSAAGEVGRSILSDTLAKGAASAAVTGARNSPESPQSLAAHSVPRPTAKPSPTRGIYCKGISCRFTYRDKVQSSDQQAAQMQPPVPELCRGLACAVLTPHGPEPAR